MEFSVRLVLWVLAAVGVVLALAFGPMVAGFVFAFGTVGFMLAMMAKIAARAISDWRLDHPWPVRHKRSA